MMSSKEDNAKGTVYYAVSMTTMAITSIFLKDFQLCFGIAVLATSLGDGFAGIVGQAVKQKRKLYKNKTPLGTLAMLVVTVLSVLLFSKLYLIPFTFWEIFSIALLCAGVELLSTHGLDNIFVPLSVSAFSYLLYQDILDEMKFAISLMPLLVALTLGKKKLSIGGAISAAALDLLIAFAFGDRGFAMLIAFFAFALITDEVKKISCRTKTKGECRNVWQVLANAIFGALCALSFLVFSHKYFLFLFVLSFAEALGDTASSGFGALAKTTVDIFHLRRVEKGESGGISLVGSLAGGFFSSVFVLLGAVLFSFDISVVLTLIFCAIGGNLFDSFLGSVVQLRYHCNVCDKIVETPTHCNESAEYHRGIRPFDNSFVNLISVAFSIALFCLISVGL